MPSRGSCWSVPSYCLIAQTDFAQSSNDVRLHLMCSNGLHSCGRKSQLLAGIARMPSCFPSPLNVANAKGRNDAEAMAVYSVHLMLAGRAECRPSMRFKVHLPHFHQLTQHVQNTSELMKSSLKYVRMECVHRIVCYSIAPNVSNSLEMSTET